MSKPFDPTGGVDDVFEDEEAGVFANPQEVGPDATDHAHDGVEAGDKDDVCSVVTSAISECLPIVWKAGCRVPSCKLCLIKSSTATNLVQNSKHPVSGGLVPWRQYAKVRDDDGVVVGRMPKGALCTLSMSLYQSLGMNVQYGTPQEFLEGVTQKKPGCVDALTKLQDTHKAWLKKHRADPETVNLQSYKKASDVEKELLVTHSRKSGFKKPKKEFVLEADWDEKEDGPWDPSKVTTEFLFGEWKKGVWKLVGKTGHFEYEEEDAVAVADVTREERGESAIVGAAIEAKRTVIHTAMAAREKERDAVTVEAPLRSAIDVFSLAGISAPGEGPEHDGDCETVAWGIGGEGGDGEDSDGDDADAEDTGDAGGKQRVAGYFQRKEKNPATAQPSATPKGKTGSAKAKAKASPGQKTTTSAQGSGMPTTAASGKGSGPSARGGPSAKERGPASPGTSVASTTAGNFTLDGRTARMQKSIEDVVAATTNSLAQISFQEELQGTALVGSALTAFQEAAKVKGRALAKLKGDMSVMFRRIENSKAGDAVAAAVNQLRELSDNVQTLTKFCLLAQGRATDLDDWEVTVEAVAHLGYPISLPYLVCALDAKVHKRALFEDYDGLFAMFMCDSKEVMSLAGESVAVVRSVAENHCEVVIDDRLRELFRTKTAERSKEDTTKALAALDSFLTHAKTQKFMAWGLVETYGAHTVRALVDCRNVPITELTEHLEKLEAYRDLPQEQRAKGPWLEHFCKTPSPLYDAAAAAADDRQGEATNEKVVQDLCVQFDGVEEGLKTNVGLGFDLLLAAETESSEVRNVGKKGKAKPLSATQRAKLEEASATARQHARDHLTKALRESAQKTVAMATEAASNNGFAVTGHLQGAVTEGVDSCLWFIFGPFVCGLRPGYILIYIYMYIYIHIYIYIYCLFAASGQAYVCYCDEGVFLFPAGSSIADDVLVFGFVPGLGVVGFVCLWQGLDCPRAAFGKAPSPSINFALDCRRLAGRPQP